MGDRRLWRDEASALLRLGAPMALTQLVQFSIHFVDVLMIGRLGAEHLAAASLGLVIYFMGWLLMFGPAMAISPLVSQAVGAGGGAFEKPSAATAEDVRVSVRMGLWVTFAVFPPLYAFYMFGGELAALLGQSPRLAARAEPYLLAAAPGLPFTIGIVVLRNFLAGVGRARVPLLIIAAMTALNAVLNYLLIFGAFGFPRLELVGAGVASALSNLAAFVTLALYASRDAAGRPYAVFHDFFRPHRERLATVLRLGLPISLTTAFEGMLFNASVLLMGLIGALEVAAFQIALNVSALAFMGPLGLSMAGAVRVGLHAGAGDMAGVRRAAGLTIAGATAMIAVVAAPVAFAPGLITSLYVDAAKPDNAPVADLVASFLPIVAAFMLFDAVQVGASQSLRGLKDVRWPMAITGVAYWVVGFPAAAFLALKTSVGAPGVWWGVMLGLASAAVMLSARLWSLIAPPHAAPAPAP